MPLPEIASEVWPRLVVLATDLRCNISRNDGQTPSGKAPPPDLTITYALLQVVEKSGERSDRARFIAKARADVLLQARRALVLGSRT